MRISASRRRPRTSIAIAVPGSARSERTYPIPMPIPSDGENVPLVTVPTGSSPARIGLPWRGIPRSVIDEGDEPLGGSVGAGGGDGLGAGEARLLLAAPAQTGLDRVAVRAHVVAVEVEADLEPERVAGAEPAGRHAGGEQRAPERRRRRPARP